MDWSAQLRRQPPCAANVLTILGKRAVNQKSSGRSPCRSLARALKKTASATPLGPPVTRTPALGTLPLIGTPPEAPVT